MITRFYYKLNEIMLPAVDTSVKTDRDYNNNYPFLSEDEEEKQYFGMWYLIDMLISMGRLDSREAVPTGEEDDAVSIELLKHVWLNLKDKYVAYIDVEHPRWEHPEKPELFTWHDAHGFVPAGWHYIVPGFDISRNLGDTIWSLFIDTKDYYIPLISMYNSELDNLLNPITTTVANNSTTTASGNNETRFNDTPQNVLSSGTYADDNFATNVTKANSGSSVQVYGGSTTQNDGMSKMARINEVQNMLRNLYGDWAFEFNKLIVGE